MTGAEIMAVVGFIILVFGFIFGLWKYVDGKLAEVRTIAEQSRADLAAHKLHAAETFATKAGLTEALGRVHDALDRLTDRIDALIASQKPPRRAS